MLNKLLGSIVLVASASQVQAIEVVDLDLTDPNARDEVKVERYCSWYGGCSSYDSPYYAMTYSYDTDGGELAVTVSGWSYGRHGIESDYVGNFSQETGLSGDYGLGVEDQWTPQHAIDNHLGDYDMILLSFDKSVSLETVSAGWRSTGGWSYASNGSAANSELSLLAFTGEESQMVDFSGEWTSLLGEQGWESAGDYQIESVNQEESVNTTGITSKYWLVGAYNSTLNGSNSGLSDGNDFFKLTGLSVKVSAVPLPGSMFLFGAALLGFGAIRRRKKA